MPTVAQKRMLDREIELFKSGAMSGDFMRRPGQSPGPGRQEQKIIRSLTIAKMDPAEKAAFEKAEAERARMDAARRSLVNTFKFTKVDGYTKAKTNANIEKLRAFALDDSNPDQWLDFYRQVYAREIVGVPLGKFRFEWGANGKPVYVPWTKQSWINFFSNPQRGRWIANIPAMYKCSPEWESYWIDKYFAESERQRVYPAFQAPGDKRKVWQHTSGSAKCKRPKKSTWVKIRKGVVGAALIVAAVYLGPVIVAKTKAILGGAGASSGAGTAASSAASTVSQATTFQKIQAGSKTLLSYVNKARTIQAIAKGELPPPPIGIVGSSFRDWAFIVAKEKLQQEAIDAAMEAGQDYIARKMTAKEEAKLKAEIAEMQRQLIAMTPPEVRAMPPEPDPELAPQIKKIQVIEEQRQTDLQKLIIPGALIVGALILGA